jgi:pimeloyl-ACP methyl ester carboxylesterase
MKAETLGIARGWPVVTSDGKRVGDVIEVHPHYLLVSRGIVLVRDLYLPIGAVATVENAKVILSVDQAALKGMNLAHIPPAPAPAEAPPPPEAPLPAYEPASYPADAQPAEQAVGDQPVWDSAGFYQEYDEQPSYTRPQLNGYVEVEPTVNLAVHDFGYGSTVFLMQGWPFDHTIWEPLPVLLAESHRVVTYDPRGLGASDRPWEFYSTEMQAADLHRLVVESALREITLVAWSSAALSALLYARDHRRRVDRLVLLNPLVPAWLANEQLLEQLQVHPELDVHAQESWSSGLVHDRAALHEQLLDRLTHRPLGDAHRRWLWQHLMSGAQHAQVKGWEALRYSEPYLEGFPEDLPVTILSAEQDRLFPPALGLHLANQLPLARHLVISGAGHASFLDQRGAIEQLIREVVLSSGMQEQEETDEQAARTDASSGATGDDHLSPDTQESADADEGLPR